MHHGSIVAHAHFPLLPRGRRWGTGVTTETWEVALQRPLSKSMDPNLRGNPFSIVVREILIAFSLHYDYCFGTDFYFSCMVAVGS